MNPAYVEKKEILMNLVLVVVFWSSPDWVASEFVAKECSEQNMQKILNCYLCAT